MFGIILNVRYLVNIVKSRKVLLDQYRLRIVLCKLSIKGRSVMCIDEIQQRTDGGGTEVQFTLVYFVKCVGRGMMNAKIPLVVGFIRHAGNAQFFKGDQVGTSAFLRYFFN